MSCSLRLELINTFLVPTDSKITQDSLRILERTTVEVIICISMTIISCKRNDINNRQLCKGGVPDGV